MSINNQKFFGPEDCPDEEALHIWLFKQRYGSLDFNSINVKSTLNKSKITKVRLREEVLEGLKKQIPLLFNNLGWFGFTNIYQPMNYERSTAYGGLGLTYNPHFSSKIPRLAQVLGACRENLPHNLFMGKEGEELYSYLLEKKLTKFFVYEVLFWEPHDIIIWIEKNIKISNIDKIIDYFRKSKVKKSKQLIKNTYADSYGFTEKTEAGSWPEISAVIDSVPMQLVRSRIIELKSHELNDHKLKYYWHRDDLPFLEYRILICLTATHSGFGIELKGCPVQYLEPGDVMIWDTSRPHRVFSNSFKKGSRVCLVLGFSPWFDLHKIKKKWQANSSFDTVHPDEIFMSCIKNNIFKNK